MKITKFVIIFSIASMLIAIANADSVSLISSTSQIYNYHISINKLNDTPPIFQFLLANSTGTPYIYPTIQNCTITNIISCNASFIKTGGVYDTMLVYQNANLYEKIALNPSEIIYNPQPYRQPTITIIISNKYIIIEGIAIAILTVLITGNIA